MTVQELYDQLSDEELKEALTNRNSFKKLKQKLRQFIILLCLLEDENVYNNLHKQAATRWLKNQSK